MIIVLQTTVRLYDSRFGGVMPIWGGGGGWRYRPAGGRRPAGQMCWRFEGMYGRLWCGCDGVNSEHAYAPGGRGRGRASPGEHSRRKTTSEAAPTAHNEPTRQWK